jgi:hypothetical protein
LSEPVFGYRGFFLDEGESVRELLRTWVFEAIAVD